MFAKSYGVACSALLNTVLMCSGLFEQDAGGVASADSAHGAQGDPALFLNRWLLVRSIAPVVSFRAQCGDLGHAAKNLDLHKAWVGRITGEPACFVS